MTHLPTLTQELQTICADLAIHGATSYTFRHDPCHQVDPVPDLEDDAEAELATDQTAMGVPSTRPVNPHQPLINSLRNLLYKKCYVRNEPSTPYPDADNLQDNSLTSLFLQANHNQDGWDAGWCIYQPCPDGRLFVQKGTRSRVVLPGEYTTYKWPGVAPVNGDMVSVRLFSGADDLQEAFYFAFGRTLSDQFDDFTRTRFYFNVKASAAVALLADVTALLNRHLIPFRFKSLVHAHAYTRADAAVLYVARRYFQVVVPLLLELHPTLQGGWRDSTPMFTKPLLPGIGMADDPGSSESFGMHRCRLVAEGIVAAWEAGSQDVAARMTAIEQRFADNGIQLNFPYLNPDSINVFDQSIFMQETQW